MIRQPIHRIFALLLFAVFLAQAVLSQETREAQETQETDLLAYTQAFQELLGEAPAIQATDPTMDTEPVPESLLDHMEQLRHRADALIQEAEALDGPPPPSLENREAGAARAYEATGEAPILALPTARSFPFGHATPEVTCVPQRVCDIELEPGERYIDHRSGDNLNWEIVPGPELPEPLPDHIALRPRGFGLHTNLVLYTTRRTYHLRLRSPEEKTAEEEAGNPTYEFDQAVRFYYPDDWVARKRADRQQSIAAAHRAVPSPTNQPLALEPTGLNADYTVKAPTWRKRRLPWQPVTIFDDGERTFVALPQEARHWDLPALLGLLPDGETYPLNPTVRDGWMIVPTLFTEAELRLGTGDKRRWLRLRNDRLYRQLHRQVDGRGDH
jgi:type IV secretion system protein TrbG